MKKPNKKRRVYRLDDLVNIACQLGCRIKLDLIPAELAGGPLRKPDHRQQSEREK